MGEKSGNPDDILAMFVRAANNHEFELDITLQYQGALVTGTTTSAKNYLEYLTDTFKDGNEVAEAIADKFSQAVDGMEEEEQNDFQFIHLKDAKIYLGDSQPTPSQSKVSWRGKLADVNGFFLGHIKEKKTSTKSKSKATSEKK
ncbi:gas vesicle accessory protein GvpU [Thalassobacillus hwangdonensis]|uniref:Gas vesicle accessory protein GvpU n=1 Tax=Thalassobacillus hwangdonensis TaxID=546108 RepID=A0ABW3L3V3_9BACI